MRARDFLAQLFADGSALLGQGHRDAELRAAFVEQISGDALEVVTAVAQLVQDAVGRLGLAAWPGARLGAQFAEHAKLSDPEAADALAAYLLYPSEPGSDWLAGRLFSSRRLDAYLRSAERDPKQGVILLALNVKSELQRLRRRADPVGTALYDNLKSGGEELVEQAKADSLGGDKLAFGGGEGAIECDAEALSINTAFETSGGFSGFDAAVERDFETATERQDDGSAKRHSPLRSALISAQMAGGILGVASEVCAVEPPCGTLHLGQLSNQLRGRYQTPASFTVGAIPTDDEGHALDLVDLGAADPAALLAAGPNPLIELFARARIDLEDEPRLSSGRRAKLNEILDRMEVMALDSAGDPPSNANACLREEMGIKPQTWSDDMKVINRLLERARSGARGGV